jgi:hypothetical protein
MSVGSDHVNSLEKLNRQVPLEPACLKSYSFISIIIL